MTAAQREPRRRDPGPAAAPPPAPGGAEVAPAASESQWRRWEVFKQDAPAKPHQAVGSVHAADADHALLTARNVFARRPRAVSMWVAPAEEVVSYTAQQLGLEGGVVPAGAGGSAATGAAGGGETYQVFVKRTHRRSMTFVDQAGEVHAASPEAALAEALAGQEGEPLLAVWLVPDARLTRSDPEDEPSFFAPAEEKTYKQQSAYGLITPGRRGGGR